MAELGHQVYTIEIVSGLAEQAETRLSNLGYNNVHVRRGDGYYGWPEAAPFDGIVPASRSMVSPITSLSKRGRRVGAYIKFARGIWDANALLLKQSPDLVKDLAFDVVDAVLRVLDPEPQLEGGPSYGGRIIQRGEQSPEALREKAHFVLGAMEQRMTALGFGWTDVTATQVYATFDIHSLLANGFVRRGAIPGGLTWHFARPPVQGLDFDVDVRGVARELVI